ncbi:MAG: hypothetical protein WC141_03975 [Arcobacteraceae bacterium]
MNKQAIVTLTMHISKLDHRFDYLSLKRFEIFYDIFDVKEKN